MEMGSCCFCCKWSPPIFSTCKASVLLHNTHHSLLPILTTSTINTITTHHNNKRNIKLPCHQSSSCSSETLFSAGTHFTPDSHKVGRGEEDASPSNGVSRWAEQNMDPQDRMSNASYCLDDEKVKYDPQTLATKALATTSSISSETVNEVGILEPIVVSGEPPTFVSAPGRRIIAVGDLHGDIDKARYALEIAGVLSPDGRDLWIGGETVLIQLGDILDRGEDEIAIMSLLRSLDIQAKAQGGAVFQINGNHETMNVEGDFRYVDSGAFDECSSFLSHLEEHKYDWEKAFVDWISVSTRRKQERILAQKQWDPWNLVKRQKGVIARTILFRPGGPLACELARNSVALKVNNWIFCHGGLLPHHVKYGMERMNREVFQWMKGLNENDSSSNIPFIATRGYDSVVWNRFYSREMSDIGDYQAKQIQSLLEETLRLVGAKAMVVGHTPQMAGINCKYNCSIWRVDVGMSSGVLDSRPEVLEIRDGTTRVIRSKRDMLSELDVADYI